jgi:hypothetical protein
MAVEKSEHCIPFAPQMDGWALIGWRMVVAIQSAVQTRFQHSIKWLVAGS